MMTQPHSPAAGLLAIDTLDDRREIHRLLHTLSPRRRVAFLQWCASRAALPGTSSARPLLSLDFREKIKDAYRCDRGDDRLTATVYLDLFAMAAQYTFDLPAAVVELERWAKGLSPSGPIQGVSAEGIKRKPSPPSLHSPRFSSPVSQGRTV